MCTYEYKAYDRNVRAGQIFGFTCICVGYTYQCRFSTSPKPSQDPYQDSIRMMLTWTSYFYQYPSNIPSN